MATQICGIYIDPPIAIARLGGSSTPLEAYQWINSPNPRSNGQTAISPAWSLRVRADATVEPYRPPQIQFRDGPLIRPVCPFFEVHVLLGDPAAPPETWTSMPLTADFLMRRGRKLGDVQLTIEAHNLKASRRTGIEDLGFGTFPPVTISADQTDPVDLSAESPPRVAVPMIPRNRSIPFGSVQWLRGVPQPAPSSADWANEPYPVRVDVLRFRYTPAEGFAYGPPDTATKRSTPTPRGEFVPVDPSRAFLDPRAGWRNGRDIGLVEPGDTYDGAHIGPEELSFGVIDDTCEAKVTIEARIGDKTWTAHCNIFVGPPDFGPDRRPFLSLADELNDRGGGNAERTAAMSEVDRDAWVEDLFSRVYETLSLLNVDVWRAQGAMALAPDKRNSIKIEGDGVPLPKNALGGFDKLRDPATRIGRGNATRPLPLTERARERHDELMDLDALRNLAIENPGRLRGLVRGPFEVEPGESTTESSMRMPPFMRNSNAQALTLSAWQYDLLMQWVSRVEAGGNSNQSAEDSELAVRAETHRRAVLARLHPNGN